MKQGLAISDLLERLLPAGKKKLLIVKLDAIGDYLLFRNYLSVIRRSRKFQDFEITLCGNSIWKDLSEGQDSAFVDNFIWVDVNGMTSENYQEQLCFDLRRKKFTVAVTPTYSRSWQIDRLVLGSGARTKIGPAGDSINLAPQQKVINDKKYSGLISDIPPLAFEFERNRSFFSKLLDEELAAIQPVYETFGQKENKVIVCPGANSASRQWSPSNFYRLCEYINTHVPSFTFYICGSASDKDLAAAIVRSGNSLKFTDLTGKMTLSDLQKFMSTSQLVLCNDSAPYHMGAMLGIPVICISNGNHYGRFCPYPSIYNKRNLEIFPPALSLPPSPEKVKQLQLQGSTYSINDITPSLVIGAMEKKRFLHDIIGHNY